MKTLLTRTIPLILCIAVGTALSWVSIYAFFFAVWIFHSVPIARASDAIGGILLLPGRWIFEFLGGDQSSIFFDPTSFSGTNGLVLGILFYCGFRAVLSHREQTRSVAELKSQPRPLEARAG